MLFVHPLYAEAGYARDDQPGQLYLTDTGGGGQRRALILDSRFEVEVTGLLAKTRLVRDFRKTSGRWQKGASVIPLPHQAAMFGLTMRVGAQRIEGHIEPRPQA